MTVTPSVLGLRKALLNYFQQAFNLSCFLNHLQVCQQFVSLLGLNVLEMGHALPASLVIDHLGCNSWAAVEAPAYNQKVGTANRLHRDRQGDEHQQNYAASYQHLCLDIEAIPEEHNGQYDLIFVVACFHHVFRLMQALLVLHRCLKPCGLLFAMHSSIWRAFDGHHLPIVIPSRFESSQSNKDQICRPWQHLQLSHFQASKVIRDRFDAEFAEDFVCYISNSCYVNLHFRKYYHLSFKTSLFDIFKYQIILHAGRPSIIQPLHQRWSGYSQFSNNGFLIVLKNFALFSATIC